MPDVDVSSIKDAILLARDLATARELRDPRQAAGGQLPDASLPTAFRDASRQVIAAAEKHCGLDRAEFDRLRVEKGAELLRVHEAARSDAAKRSGEAGKQLRREIQARRDLLESLLAAPEPKPLLDPIEAPFLIWATPSNMLSDSQIAPWSSWAKFQHRSAANLWGGNVTFDYLWQNPTDRYAVVNIDGFLILNGFGRVFQSGGWFAGDRQTSLTIQSAMHVMEWWNQPPTSQYPQPGQTQLALALTATAWDMFDDDKRVPATVFRGYDLQNTLHLVPPQGVVVIEVAVECWHSSGADGDHEVLVDFESGAFEVVSPFVLVGVLT